MTTPTAEVMITPEISRKELMNMQTEFNKTFDNIAKNAGLAIETGVSDGIQKGSKTGAKKMRDILRKTGSSVFDKLGGAKGIGGGALGLGLAGLYSVISSAQEGSGAIEEFLGESVAQRQISTAKIAGMSTSEFIQFSRTAQQGGFNDQQAINDVLFDLNEKRDEAIADGEGVLSNFTQYKGADFVNRVFASLATLGSEGKALALAEIGFTGEDAQNIESIINKASDNGQLSAVETLENLRSQNKTSSEKIAETLEKQADFERIYKEEQIKFQEEYRRKFLDALSEGDVKTFFSEKDREASTVLKVVENYEDYVKRSNEAMQAIDTTQKALEKATLRLIDTIEVIYNKFIEDKAETNAIVTSEDIANGGGTAAQQSFFGIKGF